MFMFSCDLLVRSCDLLVSYCWAELKYNIIIAAGSGVRSYDFPKLKTEYPVFLYGKPALKPNAKDGSLAIFNMLNAKDYITYSRIRTTIC